MSDYYRHYEPDIDDVAPPRHECPYRTGTALEDMCQLDNCICSYRGRECEKGLAAEEKENEKI